MSKNNINNNLSLPPTSASSPRKSSLDNSSSTSFLEHRRTSSETISIATITNPTLAAADQKTNLAQFGFGTPGVKNATTTPSSSSSPSQKTLVPERLEKRGVMNDGIPVPHRSLSKTGLNKLYDGKRHPAAAALTAAASASTLSLTPTLSSTLSNNSINTIGGSENPWQTLHVYVLPLFNGEQLGKPIEDLNALVRQHIKVVISRGFSRAISNIESDIQDLIATGMLTLSAKLAGLSDETLVPRTIGIWVHFFDQVLPYIEGVFLPAHTDALLLSLHRPKPNRPTSPTSDAPTPRANSVYHIDVRKLTLRSFRDAVILPIHTRLYNILISPKKPLLIDNAEHNEPRLQQMLLVLTSIANHDRQPLSARSQQQQQVQESPDGETAITQLLRVVRNPSRGNNRTKTNTSLFHRNPTRISTFVSAGKPRDRRGRIARKSVSGDSMGGGNTMKVDLDDGGETPKNNRPSDVFDREREREILASLRSPNPAFDVNRVSVGGWGLNVDGIGKDAEDEYEDMDDFDDSLNGTPGAMNGSELDKTILEQNFVGLKAGEMVHAQEGRRRTSSGATT